MLSSSWVAMSWNWSAVTASAVARSMSPAASTSRSRSAQQHGVPTPAIGRADSLVIVSKLEVSRSVASSISARSCVSSPRMTPTSA